MKILGSDKAIVGLVIAWALSLFVALGAPHLPGQAHLWKFFGLSLVLAVITIGFAVHVSVVRRAERMEGAPRFRYYVIGYGILGLIASAFLVGWTLNILA